MQRLLFFLFVILQPFVVHTASICQNDPTSPHNVTCSFVVGSYLPSNPPQPKQRIVVLEYNINTGNMVEGVYQLLSSGHLPSPDVILLSEADRGCQRTNGTFIADYLAQKLQMAYLYIAEFVELQGGTEENGCTTGNAILARYPLRQPRQFFFNRQCCFFSHRVGGRSAAVANVLFPINSTAAMEVRFYSVHLESGTDAEDQVRAEVARTYQAEQITLDSLNTSLPTVNVTVVGGDFNAPFSLLDDPVGLEMTRAGFVDALNNLHPWERGTCFERLKPEIYLDCDYLYSRPMALSGGIICKLPECNGDLPDSLSDHRPIYSFLEIPIK